MRDHGGVPYGQAGEGVVAVNSDCNRGLAVSDSERRAFVCIIIFRDGRVGVNNMRKRPRTKGPGVIG